MTSMILLLAVAHAAPPAPKRALAHPTGTPVLSSDDQLADVATLPGRVDGVGAGVAVPGYRTFLGAPRAVYRVDFITDKPAGDWRAFVAGETGRVLFRENLRYHASAPGSIYEVSPVETLAASCPVTAAGGRSTCAPTINVTFPNLVDGTHLIGTQTQTY